MGWGATRPADGITATKTRSAWQCTARCIVPYVSPRAGRGVCVLLPGPGPAAMWRPLNRDVSFSRRLLRLLSFKVRVHHCTVPQPTLVCNAHVALVTRHVVVLTRTATDGTGPERPRTTQGGTAATRSSLLPTVLLLGLARFGPSYPTLSYVYFRSVASPHLREPEKIILSHISKVKRGYTSKVNAWQWLLDRAVNRAHIL